MTTPDFDSPLYTPPRLRISASYQTSSTGGLESVDIELNDAGTPITADLIGHTIDSLIKAPGVGEVRVSAPAQQPAQPLVETAPRATVFANGGPVGGPLTVNTATATRPPTIYHGDPTATVTATAPPPVTFNLDSLPTMPTTAATNTIRPDDTGNGGNQ